MEVIKIDYFKNYKNLRRDLGYNAELTKKLIPIFVREGVNEVISSELVAKNADVRDFIIVSEEMDKALKEILSYIDLLISDENIHNKSMFYFTEYGGSKTQFIEFVIDYIKKEKPLVISLKLPDINSISALNLFRNIHPKTVKLIVDNLEGPKYENLLNDVTNFVTNINLGMRGTRIKDYINREITNLIKITKESNVKKELINILQLFDSIYFIDDEQVIEHLIKIMQSVKEFNVIYLFFFDEVDLWFTEEDPVTFSEKFLEKSRLFKKLFEFPSTEVNTFFLFCCTNRIFSIMSQNDKELTQRSYSANRFYTTFQNASKVFEGGRYNEQLPEAITKIAAIYSIATKTEFDEEFLSQMITTMKIREKQNTRRITNANIVKICRAYQKLKKAIESGRHAIKNREWLQIGRDIIPSSLPLLFKQLNIEFHRGEIPIEDKFLTKRLDGYFQFQGESGPVQVMTEIKAIGSQYGKNLVTQIAEWVNKSEKPVIQLIFGNVSIEEVNSIITKCFSETPEYDINKVNLIYPIIIENIYSFLPIIGVYKEYRKNPETFADTIPHVANWLDLFSEIRYQLQDIFLKLGFRLMKPPDIVSPPISEIPEVSIPEAIKSEVLPIVPSLTPTKITGPKSTDQEQKILIFLKRMRHKEKLGTSGRKKKEILARIAKDLQIGLVPELDSIYDILAQKGIVKKITTQYLTFSSDFVTFFNKTIQEFEQYFLTTMKAG